MRSSVAICTSIGLHLAREGEFVDEVSLSEISFNSRCNFLNSILRLIRSWWSSMSFSAALISSSCSVKVGTSSRTGMRLSSSRQLSMGTRLSAGKPESSVRRPVSGKRLSSGGILVSLTSLPGIRLSISGRLGTGRRLSLSILAWFVLIVMLSDGTTVSIARLSTMAKLSSC